MALVIVAVLVLCTWSYTVSGTSTSSHIVAQWVTSNSSFRFDHLAIDDHTGTVYAGAVNRLYQFKPSLELVAQVRTGPKLDNPLCHPSGCGPDITKKLTDNVNKVLVIDEESNTIIVCGSVLQGACYKYTLGNISQEPLFIPESIAANDDHSSTYAFIGPERYNPWGESKVLYIATTFTNRGDYRHGVPAIASRKLDDLKFAEYTFSQQSLLRIDVKYRDHFLVRYVYGFNASDYAYFVTVQKRSHLPGEEESGFVSRLARTCVSDANYHSYTEVTLQCYGKDGNKDYNLVQAAQVIHAGRDLARSLGVKVGDAVLVAVFSSSQGHTSSPRSESVMCVYSLRDIEMKFTENIHMCFNGSIKDRNMGYISGAVLDGKCPEAGTTGNILNFCEVGLKISGRQPVTDRALLELPSTPVTSIAVTIHGRHTVAFIGTKEGTIKKVHIKSDILAEEYDEVVVDAGSPILADLRLDPQEQFIYALTPSKLTKLRVENCGSCKDCSTCLGSMDPYCGWCSLEKRCTVRAACQDATLTSPRWLSSGNGQQCIDFEQVLPDRISHSQIASVRLTIRTLPELPRGAKYRCVFGDAKPIDAVVSEEGLMCVTPPVASRPPIPPNEDHVLVPLSVRSSETNKDFVSREFAYYDCGRHTTCQSCVKSEWACNWCVHENKCTSNSTACHGTVVSGKNNPAQQQSHGAAYCPRFRQPQQPILLPNGVRKEIVLEGENLPEGSAPYTCVVSIEGAKMMVRARVEAGRFIVCEKTEYAYQANLGEYTATVTVKWNKNHYVDTVTLKMYKCAVLGSHRGHPDCSLCLTRNAKYRCTWCGNECDYTETCSHAPASECPRPRIDLITPLSGPIEGGTLVTIEGSNLGLKKSDVQGKVSIGNIPCELVEYRVSVRIICRAGGAPHEMTAPVIVGNQAGYTESPVSYSYKDIQVIGVSPSMGPQSGGTQLSVSGRHLNIGSSLLVYLDELPCVVDTAQASSSRLVCITSRSNGSRSVERVVVTVDGANRTLDQPYNYTMDPTIMEIRPLKSWDSGGRVITVHGTNLHAVLKPVMVVYTEDDPNPVNKTECKVMSGSYMQCPSPPVDRAQLMDHRTRRSIPPTELALHIGFLMDNVSSVKDLAKYFHNLRSKLLYVPDPVFNPFSEEVKLYKGDTLVIEGDNLILASDESDVNVTIGTQPCNVTSLALTQLVCIPPFTQPEGTDEIGVGTSLELPLVVVRVGENLRFRIGYLRYELVEGGAFPEEAVAGIAASGVLLALVFVVILLVYRRKSTQAEREYKRIQIQMDTLESNVRLECKQAFAELQTDMTDLTADLESSGIPTLNHKAYVMKVFFPGVTDHPVLFDHKLRVTSPRSSYEAAMMHFEQLINNKGFLLTMIDTLEAQKTFNIRDKVNVASLLMVILMNKMEYATDVLRALLWRLVEHSVCSKHPQLMLRRTESVVEKLLTNWMALCMYGYLRDHAGASLFFLFKALKHQIEKGPVDALTQDARYSISEERLLRENIQHNTVVIHLVQDEPHYEKIPYQTYQTLHAAPDECNEEKIIQCRVLDCDTVSQVKAKILDALYKNTPFSMRPTVYDVDLEWRHGHSGRLILQDEDLTTKTVGGWRRLNTLAHYGVREMAVMTLVYRQNQSTGYPPCRTPCHNCTNTYAGTGSLYSPILGNGDIESKTPTPLYHQVKPIDEYYIHNKPTDCARTAIPEIFLTRLLSTKGTVQKFIDDFFNTILVVNEKLPPAVKWLYDLLDEAARRHNIVDSEVLHAWKSNSLPLRFWVNFIKNPDFIFDINKTSTVDGCLSVIAQTFMDACATTEHRLGKDSPSNKLLFAKDIPVYRDKVSRFYSDVASLPCVTDQELNAFLQQLSMQHQGEFDTLSALKELYIYATKYQDAIHESLEADQYCKKHHLSQKLESIAYAIGGQGSLC